MIPKYFNKMFNYNCNILTYKNDEYPHLEEYCKGVKLKFIKRSNKGHRFNKIIERNVLKYLLFNAKKIDILNLIHYSNANLRYAVYYKLINKRGFVYLKFDTTLAYFKRIDLYKWHRMQKKRFTGIFDFLNFYLKKKINMLFLDMVDLISVESKELCDFIQKKHPKIKHKVIYIPNGVDDIFLRKHGIKKVPFSRRENVILNVCRIGTYKKSSETLMEAISKIKDLKDWKVYYVGPVAKEFVKTIDDFFNRHSNLKNKIVFIGEITDKKKLFEIYQRSKIFCLTSEFGSFEIVLVEALINGNYIVSSDIPTAREITNNGSLGAVFYKPTDSDELAVLLQELINNESHLEKKYLERLNHAENNFTWSKIIRKLYREILIRKKN